MIQLTLELRIFSQMPCDIRERDSVFPADLDGAATGQICRDPLCAKIYRNKRITARPVHVHFFSRKHIHEHAFFHIAAVEGTKPDNEVISVVAQSFSRSFVPSVHGIQLASRRNGTYLYEFLIPPSVQKVCGLCHGLHEVFFRIIFCPKPSRGHRAVHDDIEGPAAHLGVVLPGDPGDRMLRYTMERTTQGAPDVPICANNGYIHARKIITSSAAARERLAHGGLRGRSSRDTLRVS